MELFNRTSNLLNDQFNFSQALTGIVETKYIKESVDLALTLNPGINQVYIINDRTDTGIQNKKAVLDIIPLYNDNLSFVFLEDYTMAELLDIVSSLPDDAIVFLNTFARDSDGFYYETEEVVSLVTSHSRVPVYSSSDYYLGDGIVGGVMVPGYEQGRYAAHCAAEILKGTQPDTIPIKNPDGVIRFDYNRLLLYNLSPDSLPEGSDVINKPSFDVKIPIYTLMFFTVLIAFFVFAIIILAYANSELKETRKNLTIHEERFRMAMEATEDGLYDWDLIRNHIYYSPGYLRMLGFKEGEIPSSFEGYTSRIHPDERDHVISEIEEYLHQKKTGKFVTDFRIEKKDGTYIWIQSRGEITTWQGGEPARMVGTHIDTTESRQYHQAIIEINKKLNILSSITRHDILNQITVLHGYFDLIRESVLDDPQCLTYLDKLHGAFDKIERQILFTRDYQNMGVEEPRWQRVEKKVQEAIKALGKTDVSFITETGDLFIYADSMLVRVLYNLYENAIRHGNGVTTIQTRFEKRGHDGVLIIQDDGIGIPDTDKERIFEKGVGSNTGLGLFLVINILAITGIKIKETGVYTKGARFEILIPSGKYRLSDPGF